MSLLRWLGFGRRASALNRPPEQRIYLVDALGLAEGRFRNGELQMSPRDNFAILRNLAQFAARENLKLIAVFTGRPLREAGEGKQYKGLQVHYAEQAATRSKKIIALVRTHLRAKDVVLITGDAQLEKAALALNAACMRPATLRKAMDEREERGERDSERPARARRERSRQSREQRAEAERSARPSEPARAPAAERDPAPPAPAAPAPSQADPGVLELIDPL